MWQVFNRTPFAAAGTWTRDRDGAEVWLVAVRCTFRISPDGTTAVAPEQSPPVLAPVYRGDPAASSLVYDSDFYPTKPTTDVLLNGHAYAPGGGSTTQVDVMMQVGDVSKALRVTGDRRGVTSASAEPFARIPLTYERAAGGTDPNPKNPDRPAFDERNPVGTTNPNVRYAGVNLSGHPAGFGPIPPHWRPRVRHAGTYDQRWHRDRCPLYPTDLDPRFFLCSPEDQRPSGHLRGGEPVELLNLTPDGWLAFKLPRVAFRFRTEFRGKPAVTHRGLLHTVILEPDVPQVVLVWHTALPAHADVLRLARTRVTQLRVVNAPAGSIPLGVPADLPTEDGATP
jgi:hypothetical protein